LFLFLLTKGLLDMPWRYAVLLAFGLNPTVMKYAVSAMAEPLYIFLAVGTIWTTRRWIENQKPRELLLASAALTGAVLTRPEGLALLVAVAVVLLLNGQRRQTVCMILLPITGLALFGWRNVRLHATVSGYWFQWQQIGLFLSAHPGFLFGN